MRDQGAGSKVRILEAPEDEKGEKATAGMTKKQEELFQQYNSTIDEVSNCYKSCHCHMTLSIHHTNTVCCTPT